MNDRIKIAEKMGWTVCHDGKGYHPNDAGRNLRLQIPDPFTDANDDCAVLGWARNEFTFDSFTDELMKYDFVDYEIGDYARAALKVIA